MVIGLVVGPLYLGLLGLSGINHLRAVHGDGVPGTFRFEGLEVGPPSRHGRSHTWYGTFRSTDGSIKRTGAVIDLPESNIDQGRAWQVHDEVEAQSLESSHTLYLRHPESDPFLTEFVIGVGMSTVLLGLSISEVVRYRRRRADHSQPP